MDRVRNFGFLLKDVSRLSAKNFERHVSEVKLGLTLAQCKVLTYLQRNEGITQVRLAFLSDTDPMTLVRILDRMEIDEWIERRLDPLDRRARRLYLKPAAMPVLKQIWQLADRARAEAFAGLDTNERNLVLDLLERIRGNLAPLVPGTAENERRQAGNRSAARAPASAGATALARRSARAGAARRRGSS